MFEVVITEVKNDELTGKEARIERLKMTVDTLNLPAVISTIQSKPRKARTPKVDK